MPVCDEKVCPCGQKIVTVYGDGRIKIRSKVLVVNSRNWSPVAVCKKCGREVPLQFSVIPKTATTKRVLHYIPKST